MKGGLRAEDKPAEKVPERRLWLTGSVESSPGVCGLYRTARTEPMGDRLRLVYKGDAQLSSAWGMPQDQTGVPCLQHLSTSRVSWHHADQATLPDALKAWSFPETLNGDRACVAWQSCGVLHAA